MGASSPQVADLDGDGILDIVCTDYMCAMMFYKGTGDFTFAKKDTLQYTSDENIVIENVDVNAGRIYGAITLNDWNSDGLLDVLFMSCHIPLRVYLNEGTATSPRFSAPQTITLPSNAGTITKYRPSVDIYDINVDGKKDIVLGGGDRVCYYLNVGPNEAPHFDGTPIDAVETDGTFIEMFNYNASPVHGESKISVCNWNNDGYPDLLVGENTGWTVGGPLGYLFIMTGKPDGSVNVPMPLTNSKSKMMQPHCIKTGNSIQLVHNFNTSEVLNFEIRALNGAKICSGKNNAGDASVNVGNLAHGMYVVRFLGKNVSESFSVLVP